MSNKDDGWISNFCTDIGLGRITNLINTYLDDQYEYQINRDVKGKLEQMKGSLLPIQAVLCEAQKMEVEDNPSLVDGLSQLKNVVYDAEYVMDLFEYERFKNEVEGWPDETTTTTTEVVEDKGSWLTNKVRRISGMVTASSSKIQESASIIAKRLVFADEDFNDLLRVVDKFDKFSKKTMTLISLLHLRCPNRVTPFPAGDKVAESRVTSSVPVEPKMYGREEAEERLLKLLQQDSNGSGTRSFDVVSIVGVGGVGKTTLAQFIFNNESLKDKFDIKAWVCISNDFSIERLVKNILEVATGMKKPPDFSSYTTFQKLQETLINGLVSKRFLIVLDDVWEDMEGKWATIQETFHNGTIGSKILITSRIHNMARAMGSQEELQIKLNSLKFKNFWPFFQQCALPNEDFEAKAQLKNIGEEIARKLGGLPLAAKAVGGLLHQNLNVNYWKQVLNSKRWKERDDKVLPALKLSYDHLPLHLKKCFVYCCLFPKDYLYEANTLCDIWVALSCIRPEDKDKRVVDIVTEYINELVNRSFLHDQWPKESLENKIYVMHDLLHDMAEKIVGDEVYRIENEESLSKKIPRSIRHLYIKSAYNGLDLVLQKIAPKQLQSLVFVELASVEETEWKFSKKTIRHIEGLRFLSFGVEKFSVNEMRLWNSLGDMKHLRCANFTCKELYPTHASFPISLRNPYQLKILRSNIHSSAENKCDNLHKLVNLQIVQLAGKFMTPYLGRLKYLEMVPGGGIFIVDGKDGNDIGQLEELNNIGGMLTLKVKVVLSNAEATKAYLNRKQYLVDLDILGNVEDEALDALQPHKNLQKLKIKGSTSITATPKWLHMLSNLTKLHLFSLPNLQGLDLGCHLSSLEILELYYLPLVRQIEVVASGPVFPSLVCIKMYDMKNMEGWCLQSCKHDTPTCFPKLSKIMISKCPKLLKSGGSFTDRIIRPIPSPNCNIALTIFSYDERRRYFREEERTQMWIAERLKMWIDDMSFLPAIDDCNDPKNNMFFRCVHEIIYDSSIILPAALLFKFSSLGTLTIKDCFIDSLQSLDVDNIEQSVDTKLPKLYDEFKIKRCEKLKLLSATNTSLQTVLPSSSETLVIEKCLELESLVGQNIDINHVLLPFASVKTLIIKGCRQLIFLSLPTLFPSLEKLQIKGCRDLLSLGELNDDNNNNELPPSINALIIEGCDRLSLSAGTLQMLPSIQQVEIKGCKMIKR